MLKFLFSVICFSAFSVFAQNHEENFRTIHTIEQANAYAASFSEVSTGLVNAEKDVFFFDDIDTTDLAKQVGTTRSFFGRTTKLIKDSVVSIVNVQIISFDLSKVSAETAEILMSQMEKRLESGESYWDIKKKFGHTSAYFSSSPEPTETVAKQYSIEPDSMLEGSYFRWETFGSSNKVGILIVDDVPHDVPGFYTISYINLNSEQIR